MASYKVAQDVEADDKLLGPFGFRQFIYLIIVAMALIIGYGLWKLFPPLAVLPLPIVILFGALALPLRKDQPMETYLAAMVSFYLKPRQRLWQPDGVEQIVEIIAPKTVEDSLTKDFGGGEADRRLSYLADIADSRGWAIRHSAAPMGSTSMISDVYNDAQATEDILGDSGNIAQNIDSLIDRADAARKQNVLNRINSPQPTPQPPVPGQYQIPQSPISQPSQNPFPQQPLTMGHTVYPEPQPQVSPASVHYNPYPEIHQSVIQPLSEQAPQTPGVPQMQQPTQPQPTPQGQSAPSAMSDDDSAQDTRTDKSTSESSVSPDIMNLANNSKNLSVETIAHEAKRLNEKKSDGEVVISLR